MEPELAHSPMTDRWYVVTRWRKDGSAQTKYDVTDQIFKIQADAVHGYRKAVVPNPYVIMVPGEVIGETRTAHLWMVDEPAGWWKCELCNVRGEGQNVTSAEYDRIERIVVCNGSEEE